MRKTLAVLTMAAIPFGVIATTSAPALAYECEHQISDDITIDCNRCEESSRVINGITRKITGNDEVQCLQ